MQVNRVDVGDQTILNLTEDAVTPETLLEGVTAHNAAGEQITGSAVIPTKISELTNDVGFITRLRYGNLSTDESRKSVFSKDLRNNHECWERWVSVNSFGDVENAPESGTRWYETITGGAANRGFQIAIGCYTNQRNIFIRYMHDNVWSNWYQLGTTMQQVASANISANSSEGESVMEAESLIREEAVIEE